jgi:hypothetical protein
MAERPAIAHGSWIRIGSRDCIVSVVRAEGDAAGDCEVVFNPGSPVVSQVRWNGGAWEFVETAMSEVRADKVPRLTAYVQALKRGPA